MICCYRLSSTNTTANRERRIEFSGRVRLDLGSATMEVIATPKHTEGHPVFYFKKPNILFYAINVRVGSTYYLALFRTTMWWLV